MDIDLMKDRVAGINESMRRIRRNDDDAACFHFTLFVSDRDDGGTFDCESDFDVGMPM